MKKQLLVALLLTVSGATVHAQEVQPAPNQESLKQVEKLLLVDNLWNKTLDWRERGASTADIVAHIRTALGPDTNIEVRAKDANLSSFTLDKAPLGPTLTSIASLANSKVWAFPTGLIIAPEALLTDNERAFIKNGMGGEWQNGATAGLGEEWQNSALAGPNKWDARQQLTRIALPLIGADLKARLTFKGGVAAPVTLPPLPKAPQTPEEMRASAMAEFNRPFPYELPVGELSPETKGIIQDLFDAQARVQANAQIAFMNRYPNRSYKAPQPTIIDSSTIVGFDDTNPKRIELRVQKPDSTSAEGNKTLGRWDVQKS